MYLRRTKLTAIFTILSLLPPSTWAICTPLVDPNNPTTQVSISPPPVEYDSGRILSIGEAGLGNGCSLSGGELFCSRASIPLTDGMHGAQNFTPSDGLAWNRNVEMIITIQPTLVTGVNLFFYNIPSMGIGLPHEIELYWGSTELIANNQLARVILRNQDLTQDDDGLRNVTIVATANGAASYASIGLRFRFSDNKNNIRWLLLTEIEICNEAISIPTENPIPVTSPDSALILLDPDNVQSQLNLRCTADEEGSFQWQWGEDPAITFANANRTSFYTLAGLSSDSAGSVVCEARYANNMAITGSRNFTIEFDPSPAILKESNVMPVIVNTSVNISCELYGYLERGFERLGSISWRTLSGIDISGSGPIYSISNEDGSRRIQNGGSMSLPSYVSTLTINVVDTSVADVYFCSGSSSLIKPIDLRVEDTPAPTTTPQQPVTSSTGSDSPIVAIVASVVGIMALLIFIGVLIVAIFLIMRARRYNPYHLNSNGGSKDFDMYDGDDPLYQEVSKPLPPPIPARFPSPMGSSQIDPYAMVNNATGNGHFELMDKGFDNRVSVCSEPESNTMPMRLNKQPNFLQNNPLYASADALDRADPPNLPFRREMGSVPPLGYSDSPRGSAFNIYAQPSRVAPPIPERPSTPTLLGGPIYSEANINPAVFKQLHRSAASPPEDHMCPYASVYNEPKPLQQSEGPLEMTRHNIKEKGNLGVGQFGQVVLAETIGVSLKDLNLSDTNDDRSVAVLVAVKKLKPDADEFIKEAFEKEIKFMTRLKHENVVQLLGICLHEEAFIVMEYMEKGDLNQCLRKSEIAAPDATPGHNQLLPSTLLYMSLQIANGMKYLASFHFIHRDLATRNCLVGKNYEVKIADFGMSRSLYSSYYYRIRGRAMLPIRWMANECFYGKFSEKTDVWAFGVTMWEVYTLSRKQPYETMTDQEVIDDAIKGPDRTLLTRPEHCPPEVFDVMVDCWVDDPDKRVDFNEVHSSLAKIYYQGSS